MQEILMHEYASWAYYAPKHACVLFVNASVQSCRAFFLMQIIGKDDL